MGKKWVVYSLYCSVWVCFPVHKNGYSTIVIPFKHENENENEDENENGNENENENESDG